MQEAGFSISFQIIDSQGRQCQITMRDENRDNWKEVLKTRAQVLDAIGAVAPQQVAPPQQAQLTGPRAVPPQQDGEHEDFEADTIFRGVSDRTGEPTFKIRGGRYKQHGVTVWPEVLPALGIDPETLHNGPNPISGLRVRALLGPNKEGQIVAKKIVGRAA